MKSWRIVGDGDLLFFVNLLIVHVEKRDLQELIYSGKHWRSREETPPWSGVSGELFMARSLLLASLLLESIFGQSEARPQVILSFTEPNDHLVGYHNWKATETG